MSALFNRIEMVELLLSRGADPHARDAALNSAELMGTSETAEQL